MEYDKLLLLDFETTGLNPKWHEIIEIAAICVDMKSLDILWEHEQKIWPGYFERAEPKALEVNGYSMTRWANERAKDFDVAFPAFCERLDPTMIHTGQNVFFDIQFYLAALEKLDLGDRLDPTSAGYSYHRLDLTSMAFPFQSDPVFSMKKLAPVFGVAPEPEPHRALNGVRTVLEIMKQTQKMGRIARWGSVSLEGPKSPFFPSFKEAA